MLIGQEVSTSKNQKEVPTIILRTLLYFPNFLDCYMSIFLFSISPKGIS